MYVPVPRISAIQTGTIGIDNSSWSATIAGPSSSSNDSMEFNHASNVLIVFSVGVATSGIQPSCTLGGQALTLIGSAKQGVSTPGINTGILLVYYKYVSNSGTDTISCSLTGGSFLGLLTAIGFTGVSSSNPVEEANSNSAQSNANPVTATATISPGTQGRRIVYVSLANVFYPVSQPRQHPPCALYSSASMNDIIHGTTEESECLNSAEAFEIAYQDSSAGQSPTSTFNVQPTFSTAQYEAVIFALLPSNASISTSLSSTTIPAGGSVSDSATLSGVTNNANGTVTYNVYPDSCSNNAVRIPSDTSTVQVTRGVVPTSKAFVFQTVGEYGLNAVYSGDANNNGAASACELLIVGSTLITTTTTTSRFSSSLKTTSTTATATLGTSTINSTTTNTLSNTTMPVTKIAGIFSTTTTTTGLIATTFTTTFTSTLSIETSTSQTTLSMAKTSVSTSVLITTTSTTSTGTSTSVTTSSRSGTLTVVQKIMYETFFTRIIRFLRQLIDAVIKIFTVNQRTIYTPVGRVVHRVIVVKT